MAAEESIENAKALALGLNLLVADEHLEKEKWN
jgi:hypothetical protein